MGLGILIFGIVLVVVGSIALTCHQAINIVEVNPINVILIMVVMICLVIGGLLVGLGL